MKFLIAFLVIMVCIGITVRYPHLLRTVKSVWLIIQTSPYSQTGSGGGRIVVIGDSTAYGTGVYQARDSIAGKIGSDYPTFSVETYAQNGRVIAGAIPVLELLSTAIPVDLLLLQIGGNDILGNHPPEAIEADTRRLLREAKKRARQVIFMSSGNVGTAAFYVQNGQPDRELEKRTLAARAIFIKVAAELEVTYVDLFEPNATDPFLQAPELYFSLDGLHPSAAGYNLWYQKLLPYIKALVSAENK